MYRDNGSCTQCEALMVNGVYCHEIGCPVERRERLNERLTDDMEEAD
jgi:hypothetical protein